MISPSEIQDNECDMIQSVSITVNELHRIIYKPCPKCKRLTDRYYDKNNELSKLLFNRAKINYNLCIECNNKNCSKCNKPTVFNTCDDCRDVGYSKLIGFIKKE